MDIRFIVDDLKKDLYVAKIVSANCIDILCPASNYSLLNDRDFISARDVGENCVDAMDDARHKFTDDKKAREMKCIRLRFPSDHLLSAKEINGDATDDGTIPFGGIAVNWRHPGTGAQDAFQGVNHFAVWTVANLSVAAKKRGRVAQTGGQSAAAALFGFRGGVPSNFNGNDGNNGENGHYGA